MVVLMRGRRLLIIMNDYTLLIFQNIDYGVAFHVIEVDEEVGFVLLGYFEQIVVFGARQHMEQDMVDFQIVLLNERPVTLADIDAIAEFADNLFLYEKYQVEYSGQLVRRQLPRLFDMALRHDQQMPRHLVRVAQYNLRQLILFQNPLLAVAKRTYFIFSHGLIPSYGGRGGTRTLKVVQTSGF